MTEHKYEVGDNLRITGDTAGWGHEVPAGTELIVVELDDDFTVGAGYKFRHEGTDWFVHEQDVEPVSYDIRTSVYLAGPMRNYAEFNFPAFQQATDDLRLQGYNVISPAEHDLGNGFRPSGMDGTEDLSEIGFDLNTALLWDLEQVAHVDGIVLLPGWEHSSGVRAELALAAALGKWAFQYGAATTGQFPAAFFLDQTGPRTPAPPVALPGGEVRVTNAATGGEKGTKEARFDLIPVEALTLLARLYGKGAAKYADNNWRRGYDWSLSYAAMQRHATAWWGGEDLDPEMRLTHMASVAWHAFTMMTFELEHPELDNRPTKVRSV